MAQPSGRPEGTSTERREGGSATVSARKRPERDRSKVVTRLRSIAGHVQGVERMVAEGAYCIDIVRQTLAIQRALDRVNGILLEDHLAHCATAAMQSGDPRERNQTINEIMEVFELSSKL